MIGVVNGGVDAGTQAGRNPRVQKFRLMVACGLLAPGGAWAQQIDANAPVATELDAVNVMAQPYDAQRDETVLRVVMEKEELSRFGDDRLVDALRRMPGVSVREAGPGRRGGVALRGLADGYAQILVDGQRAPAGFDLDSVPMVMVERIEIIPSAVADASTQGIAGTINFVMSSAYRRQGGEAVLALGNSAGSVLPSASLSRTVRSGSRTTAIDASVSRREYDTRIRRGEKVLDSFGRVVEEREGARVITGDRSSGSIAPRVALDLARGGSLEVRTFLEASAAHRDTRSTWTSSMDDASSVAQSNGSNAIDVVQMQSSLDWTHVFASTARFSSRLAVGGNRERAHYAESIQADDGRLLAEETTEARLRVSGWTSSGKYMPARLGDHSFQSGWSVSDDQRAERSERTFFGGGLRVTEDRSFKAGIRRTAFYSQDEWEVTSRFSMYMGLRWERLDTSSRSDDGEVANTSDVISPILQTLWKLPGSKQRQVRLSLSSTYRAPELRQLVATPYLSLDNGLMQPDLSGNPDLIPERANGLDLGFEQHLTEDAKVTVGAYFRNVRDVIRDDVQLEQDRWVSRPINAGRARIWGGDVAIKSSLQRFFKRAPDIQMNASLAWNDSRVSGVAGPDNRLASQTPWQARVSADYNVTSRWKVGGSLGIEAARKVRTSLYEWERESSRGELDLYGVWTATPGGPRVRLSSTVLLASDQQSQRYVLHEQGGAFAESRRRNELLVRLRWELPLN
ncbi:TonB-dependent receptor [Stenotrophomonas sp. S48]|uniref:TonB-dependent receptor plug domain-containing protein n=1 Tax=unclassified Stenotrophomonas TaxID=196198 RepID=UPI0018FF5489|nr:MULTISPECIES: TonB-dependent receptor [unclassified Stenotrophomonas]MBK0024537.1 TonB-dependent receptor [Stenotrophomonas sp. S48]MBK0046674.1 TonB-dependent receptor [Stenotrophomonas sp. S49]